jgi:GDP-L-fucose synthase
VSRLSSIGWKYKTELEDGLKKTYSWFLKKYK